MNGLRSHIKTSKECFIRYPNTSKSVKKTRLHLVFSTHFSVFGYPDETLFLVFDILLGIFFPSAIILGIIILGKKITLLVKTPVGGLCHNSVDGIIIPIRGLKNLKQPLYKLFCYLLRDYSLKLVPLRGERYQF